MFSRLPSSSTWTGAIAVMTPTCGRAIRARSRIWPEPAHRHLRHDDLGVGLDQTERERQADLVVEAVRRRDRAPVRAQQRREDVLCRGLPHRARDRHDLSIAPCADGIAERCERCVRVVGNERRRSAAGARVVEERLAAGDDDEEVAGFDAPRVDPDAGDRLPRRLRACRARAHAPRRASTGSRERLLRSLAVVERKGPVGELLALLRALARDEDDVAGGRELDRAPMAAARSSSTSTGRSAPATISATIASGSSLRGLSDVTIATSASSAASFPMSGRLPRSRSPPAPTTTMTWFPSASSRDARSTFSSASGLWA